MAHTRAARVLTEGLQEGVVSAMDAEELIDLDRALDQLAVAAPRLSCLVELGFFAGLRIEDAAELLDCSPRTAKRD